MLLILLGLGFESLMLYPLLHARIEAPRLKEQGVFTEAEVFYRGSQIELEYFFVNIYNLSYRFSVADPESGQAMTFTDSQFVSGSTWERLNTGEHVTVVYLPFDPRVSRLAGTDTDDTDLDDTLFSVTLCGLPLLMAWGFLSWSWQKGEHE